MLDRTPVDMPCLSICIRVVIALYIFSDMWVADVQGGVADVCLLLSKYGKPDINDGAGKGYGLRFIPRE